jgi:hypothetical protein
MKRILGTILLTLLTACGSSQSNSPGDGKKKTPPADTDHPNGESKNFEDSIELKVSGDVEKTISFVENAATEMSDSDVSCNTDKDDANYFSIDSHLETENSRPFLFSMRFKNWDQKSIDMGLLATEFEYPDLYVSEKVFNYSYQAELLSGKVPTKASNHCSGKIQRNADRFKGAIECKNVGSEPKYGKEDLEDDVVVTIAVKFDCALNFTTSHL